ncbi:hypothetical protein CsatB_020139 [Cannabis sativa]|uniref:Uncharacterized protein n=1 Tax=Cannabis sativa TaxID=3483 RepID=A0A7J6E0Y1_CANSA|nr:uncharacterized protein LOC133030244 [Cannabis sativa]KAF4352048.1 hypothetical protein F8388_021823 [Cannabis sativa]KAF4396406.1 hypothetical protein G4B88_019206 [Cannabis sativa]
MMWRRVTTLGQNLQNIRKSPRVADESMFGGGNNQAELPIIMAHDHHGRSPAIWKGFTIICSVVGAPILSLFACFSQSSSSHHVNGGNNNNNNISANYGVWATGEFAQISEMNHLMVSDSMRYAILM